MKVPIMDLEKMIEFGGILNEDWKEKVDPVRETLNKAKEQLCQLYGLDTTGLAQALKDDNIQGEWFANSEAGPGVSLKLSGNMSPCSLVAVAFILAELACQAAEIEV